VSPARNCSGSLLEISNAIVNERGKYGFYFRNRGSKVLDMKFILPLLLIAFSGFAQEAKTREHKILVAMLYGMNKNRVTANVSTPLEGDVLDKSFKEALETKMELFKKRNKLKWVNNPIRPVGPLNTYEDIGMIHFRVRLTTLKPETKILGYYYEFSISRNLPVKGSPITGNQMNWRYTVNSVVTPEKSQILNLVNATLDKITLAILDLPEPKRKK
jgi:hypothetical protein